jgi:hypothetical protein
VELRSSPSESFVATLTSPAFDALTLILPGGAASHPKSFFDAAIEAGAKSSVADE